MDRAQFINTLKQFGFRVDRQGFIKTPDDEPYGFVRNTDFKAPNGEYVPITDAVSGNYEEYDKTLTLFNSNGDVVAEVPYVASPKADGTLVIEKMPVSDSELNDAFSLLYPDAYDMLYYDVLKERVTVDMAMFDAVGGVQPMSDYIENIYMDHIERQLKAHNFVGKAYPGVDVRRRVLDVQAHKHLRNKFREWVESIQWDGVPRVATWFKKVFNGTAPPLQDLGLEDTYLARVSEAWFMGGIRRMYTKCQHDIVPVLIGPQGVGKTKGLEYTAGSPEWFASTTVCLSMPDGEKKFLEAVKGRIIVELGESKTMRSSDHDTLKAFISKTEDQYRKSYGRYEGEYPRHFIIAATTNIANVFTDTTGNRRYYPIYCKAFKSLDDMIANRRLYDVEQVWAEALHLYREGQKDPASGKHVWYIESTWAPAVVMQKYATQDNTNTSFIDEWLDDENNNCLKIGTRLTRTEIIERCFAMDPSKPLPKDYSVGLKSWANSTTCWQKKVFRVGDKTERGWERIALPGSSYEYDEAELKKEIEKIASQELTVEQSAVNKLRKNVEEYGVKEDGVVPIIGMSQREVEYLFDKGMIYLIDMAESWDKGEYRLTELV